MSMDDLIEIKNNNKTGTSQRGDRGVWDVKAKIKMQDSVKLKMLILYQNSIKCTNHGKWAIRKCQ